MTQRLQHNRLLKNRKGYSGIIAAIFMVLIALFLFFNVFMFMLDRNTAFQDTASQAVQMVLDRSTEQFNVTSIGTPVISGKVTSSFNVTNISPLGVLIKSVWVKDSALSSTANYGYNSTSIVLQPGQTKAVNVSVAINGALPSDSSYITTWFVTARGNTVVIPSRTLAVVTPPPITTTLGIDGYSSASMSSGYSMTVPSFLTAQANDVIYLSVVEYGSSVSAPIGTPPDLSSWTLRASIQFGSYRLETWYAIKTLSGAVGDITVNFRGYTNWAGAIVFGISGANTINFNPANPSTLFDVLTPPSATGSGQSASVNIITSNANDLIIGSLGVWCPVTITNLNQWTDFTLIATKNAPPYLATSDEYQVVSTSYPSPGLVVGYYWNAQPYVPNWAITADAVKKAT